MKLAARRQFELSNASLCSLAIALWGWQTGLLFVALPMLIVLEARRVVRQRWEMSLADLKEIAKLSGAILLLLFAVILFAERTVFIYTLLQWLPVAGFPLVAAQTYGIGVLETLRDGLSHPDLLRQGVRRQRNPVNLHYVYFALCILAASAADSDNFVFYGGASVLVALLLWTLRPQRSAPILWLLLFCLATGLGFAGHVQLARFQQRLETRVVAAMLGSLASGRVNPDGGMTRMGSVGRLKLSNQIAFRVSVAPSESESEIAAAQPTFPLLLREATYNQYQLAAWAAENSLFQPVPPGQADGSWILKQAGPAEPAIAISDNLARGGGILPLPYGSSQIRQLPVAEMQRNQYGAVQVDATGDITYEVQFSPNLAGTDRPLRSPEAPPSEADLQIPKEDSAAIEQTLARLAIAGKSEGEIVSQIAAYFQNFQYSLDLLRPSESSTPVSDFLLETQAGHCEYFASATALLLRGAGIPARYAVGYSVHEFSPLEGQYIVRSRDAHAWTLVYLEGQWQTLDTTPPDWRAQEKEMESSLQSISDFFSFAGFRVTIWIRRLGDMGLREILAIATPVFGYLVFRTAQQFQGQRTSASRGASEETSSLLIRYGLDSELFEIEQALNARGLERSPSESFRQWRDRLQTQLPEPQWSGLKEILLLHYRYRFDPQGLTASEREALKALSQRWTEAFTQNTI